MGKGTFCIMKMSCRAWLRLDGVFFKPKLKGQVACVGLVSHIIICYLLGPRCITTSVPQFLICKMSQSILLNGVLSVR